MSSAAPHPAHGRRWVVMTGTAVACFLAGTAAGWWMRDAGMATPPGDASELHADVVAGGGDGAHPPLVAPPAMDAAELVAADSSDSSDSSGARATNASAAAHPAESGRERLRARLLAAGADDAEADGVIALIAANDAKQREARFALMQTRRTEDPAQRAEQRRAWRAARNVTDPGQAIRSQFGDAAWERYLYASGQPNRTRVTSVSGGSDAEQAGLQRGDVLLRYDSHVVHAMDDVLALAADDAEGATADLEVLRGGDRRVLSVARGPLGIDAEGVNINPREL